MGAKGGPQEKKSEAEVEREAQKNSRLEVRRESRRDRICREMCWEESLIRLTRSPDRGLFFGLVGKASSFGFVSMAQ